MLLSRSLAAVTVLACIAGLSAQAPPITILGHWQLDETSGAVANDAGPLGNHGALVNFGATPWVPAQMGNGLSFDGFDDYVDVMIANDLPVYDGLGSPFAICFWVKAPTQNDNRVYSEQAASPPNSGPLFTLGSGSGNVVNHDRLRVFIRTDGLRVTASAFSNGAVFDDTWHHVAYVDVAGVARIYVDGTLDSVLDYSRFAGGPAGSVRGTYAGLDSVTLGAVVRNGNVAAPLLGIVDDLRVYRSSLNLAGVQAVMAGGHPSTCIASLGIFGRGCGPGPLEIVATGSAAFGGTIYLQLFRGTPNSTVFVCSGAGRLQPVDLTSFGLPGCTAYYPSLSCFLAGVTGPAGSSMPVAVSVPNDPSLGCSLLGFQGAVLGAGVELSPAALAHLGL